MPEGEGPRPVPNRIVKPRKVTHSANRPVIATDGEHFLTEDGRLVPYSQAPLFIAQEPSSIFVTHQPGHLLRDLHTYYRDQPRWQFRVSPVEREIWTPSRRKRTTVLRDTTVAFFGFKGENGRAGHYHYPVSPMTFVLKSANEIRRGVDEDASTLNKLLQWGKDLRAFLVEQELALRPSSGGIASQLLRDSRFYPEPRRKVPRDTNYLARMELPGNFYRLYDGEVGKTYRRVTYLDQTASHHSIAKRLAFPCANELRRKGRWSTRVDKPYCKSTSPHFKRMIAEHGLFRLGVNVPPRGKANRYLPPALADVSPGFHYVYLYSNEIEWAKAHGVTIHSIVAQWTSPSVETGLNKYAEFALEQISKARAERKAWLKPVLLSTYGMLAAKPRILEFGYAQARGSEFKRYPCGSGFIDVKAKRADKQFEPTTANVLHRGMIEAETRLESLRLAEWLEEGGHSVLGIYADSVFVVSRNKLPLLPPPWKVEAHLTSFRFKSAVAFRSHELDKLPGVPSRERGPADTFRRATTTRRRRAE